MANVSVKAFSAGELAPALYARTDVQKYETGLRQCRNFMVMRQGGATKRPGTEYICAAKDATKKARLIPFVFSVTDTLVLEFGEHYIRFLQNGGVVIDPANPSDPYEIATPYLETDLFSLKYVQSGDVITIVHPTYPPKELKRFGDANWTLTDIAFGPSIDPPGMATLVGGGGFPAVLIGSIADYIITAVSVHDEESLAGPESGTPAQPASDNPIRLSWTAVTGATSYKVYRRIPYKLSDGGVFGYLGETITTSFSDDGSVIPDITLQPPVPFTGFQQINDYPSVVTYYQQRLVFAASNNNPDTFWASRTGFFHNFTTSTVLQDDDAITDRLVSEEIDRIEHIVNVGRMVVGSQGADWIVEGDANGVLTPASVNSRVGSTDGVSSIRPIKAGNYLLFVQALGAQIRQLQANVQFGYYSLSSSDLTVYSSHLVDGYTIVDWTWQQIWAHCVWAVRSDGVLLGLTYIPEQEVLAWHRHDTKGFVESVCAVPEGQAHFVYWVVKRLIQGEYVRYIERQTTLIDNPTSNVANIVTPPAPPPPPPPTSEPIAPPTNPSTTDIATTSATANWIAGNISAASLIQIRVRGATLWSTGTSLPAGQQSNHFTGLLSGTNYEWRVEHVIGTDESAWLGPVPGTQFTTVSVTPTLTNPTSAPTITDTAEESGVTRTTIQWPASPQGGNANVQIAGPTSIAPTDGEFTQVGFGGTFAAGVTAALWNITATGDYWLRVRYELDGFTTSAFVTSGSATTITVLP